MLIELCVRDLGVIAGATLVLGPGMTALTGETGAGKTLVVEALELLVGGRPDPVLVRPGAEEASVEGRFELPNRKSAGGEGVGGGPGGGEEAGGEAGSVDEGRGGSTGAGKAGSTEVGEAGQGEAGSAGQGEAGQGEAGQGEAGSAGQGEAGAGEAGEVVLARVVPANGRSRAWVNGRMAPVSSLAEVGATLVELHGQHAHQSLLGPAAQRAALDAFGGVDDGPRLAARAALRQTADALGALGGDGRARSRQVELLRYQIEELGRAGLSDPDEDETLAVEEDRLSRATAHREAAQAALAALVGDAGVSDALGTAMAALVGHPPLAEVAERLRSAQAELEDLAGETRLLVDALEDDPERLAVVRARRQLLRELQRKYGESLAEVIAFADDARRELAELESHETRVAELEADLSFRRAELAEAEMVVGDSRRRAAPDFAKGVEAQLRSLAMASARFEVEVDSGVGDQVCFALGANQGELTLPLAKVASGGELARTMLAVRLVLGTSGKGSGEGVGPRPTLVFDEVDAGVGGEAALAVGRALAALGATYQVLVVTHLAQVAAYADHQVKVEKLVRDGRTVAELSALDDEGRVVELSRMLSGQPDSAAARGHAAELLKLARRNPGP